MRWIAFITCLSLFLALVSVGCEDDKQHVYRESTRGRVIEEDMMVTPDEEGEMEKTGEDTTIIRTEKDKVHVYHESTERRTVVEDEPIVTGD